MDMHTAFANRSQGPGNALPICGEPHFRHHVTRLQGTYRATLHAERTGNMSTWEPWRFEDCWIERVRRDGSLAGSHYPGRGSTSRPLDRCSGRQYDGVWEERVRRAPGDAYHERKKIENWQFTTRLSFFSLSSWFFSGFALCLYPSKDSRPGRYFTLLLASTSTLRSL